MKKVYCNNLLAKVLLAFSSCHTITIGPFVLSKRPEVMEKWAPGSSKDPRMKLVGALTYRKLLSYPESAETAKHSDEIDADLKACSR